MRTISFSKTFKKGDEAFPDMLDFVMNNIETEDTTPEANSGELQPPDPQDSLKFKYVITVRKFYL